MVVCVVRIVSGCVKCAIEVIDQRDIRRKIIKVVKLNLEKHLSGNAPVDEHKNQSGQTKTCPRGKSEPKPMEGQPLQIHRRVDSAALCGQHVKSSQNIQVTKDATVWQSVIE